MPSELHKAVQSVVTQAAERTVLPLIFPVIWENTGKRSFSDSVFLAIKGSPLPHFCGFQCEIPAELTGNS